MTQEIIDFGSFPNDPAADAIRIAFQKVQNNFSEVYLTTISTGVSSVTTGLGLDQNDTIGDITISANIANITIQTGSSLQVGVGALAGATTATITTGSTPFVIDVGNTVTTNRINANYISGHFMVSASAQPNITSVGNLTALRVIGTARATHFAGDLIGNVYGCVQAPGSDMEVMLNSTGFIGSNPNLTFDGITLTVTGDVTANNINAQWLRGDGYQISNIDPENIRGGGSAQHSAISDSITGGVAGSIVYQSDVDVTAFTDAGTLGQVLTSAGESKPTWNDGTISGVALGQNLFALEIGNWLLSDSDSFYDGSQVIRLDVNGNTAWTGVEANTVVIRDSDGNVYANWFVGNVEVPGASGTVLFNTAGTMDVDPDFYYEKIPQILHAPFFQGNFIAPGSDTQVMFNNQGKIDGNIQLTFDFTTGLLTSFQYAGNGHQLSETYGPNVTEWVHWAINANAVISDQLSPSAYPALIYNDTSNSTKFISAPSTDTTQGEFAVLAHKGVSQTPYWEKSTISGIHLGQSLHKLVAGNYLKWTETSLGYDGNVDLTLDVDATYTATGDKIVLRNSSGNIQATQINGTGVRLTGGEAAVNSSSGALVVSAGGGIGVAGNIFANGNIIAPTIGNTESNIYGKFNGTLKVNGGEKEILFITGGAAVSHEHLRYDKDDQGGTFYANHLSGNGIGITWLSGACIYPGDADQPGWVSPNNEGDLPHVNVGNAVHANKADSATSANTAKHILGGAAGAIPWQIQANQTGWSSQGTTGQVLVSGGDKIPTWAAGTISGIPLGSDLPNLSNGAYILGGNYSGKTAKSWTIDATTAPTGDKIVVRSTTGGISAKEATLTGEVTITGANVTVATGGFFVGDGSKLTNVARGTTIVNGTSNVAVALNSDITTVVTGTTVVTAKTTGLTVSGKIDVTGKVTATGFVGSGAELTAIPAAAIVGEIAKATLATTATTAGSVPAAGVVGKVASAVIADSATTATTAGGLTGGTPNSLLLGGSSPAIAPGTSGQVLTMGSAAPAPGVKPIWGPGTISGVNLGGTLFPLTPGVGLTGNPYKGDGGTLWAVDATPAATPNKVVIRDGSGSFAANTITATKFSGSLAGGAAGSLVYQSGIDTTNFIPPGTAGHILVSTGASGATWQSIQSSITNPSHTPGFGIIGSIYNGSQAQTWTIDATPVNTVSKIVSRGKDGEIAVSTITTTTLSAGTSGSAGTIIGRWSLSAGSTLNATYADLAEYYRADQDIEPGTVVEFGGEEEIRIGTTIMSNKVAGVVTSEPAYTMNSNLDCAFPVAVALQGRVPVKVTGKISKGDMLVSAGNGLATSCSSPQIGTVIGKSLENFEGEFGMIEVAIGKT